MGCVIVSDIADPVLRFAALTAAGAVALVVVLIAAILLVRAARKLGEWRARRLARDWRPVLAQCAVAAPETFPTLRARERYTFLDLWNHHYELLRGEAQHHLRVLARGVGIAPFARRLLQSRSMRQRLIAMTTLGHLHDTASIATLGALARHRSPTLSFAAARALLEISPATQLPQLLPLIAARRDWPLSAIALALKDLGADTISEPLAHAALEASREASTRPGVPRLVHLMELAHGSAICNDVDQLLRRAEYLGPEVIAPCLRLLNDPRQAHWARQFLSHNVWYVRVAAATTLQRIGGAEDCERLLPLLGDAHWWVRYRAAHALARLPGMAPQRLDELAANTRDRFAAQMLRHVAAEERFA
ncbi:MAG: hypothetical protein FJY56_07280 [Betaproteobacteria bacterium]|nr:hypothetical protein [Betaproteobacteria bacterium]